MHVLAKLRGSALAYGLFLFSFTTAAEPAFAEVLISVNKSTQQMSVLVDGVPRYGFAVSTGRAGYGTPNGTYHPQRLAASWFSKLYYNSPMPHSIFFHGGYAIHGSYEINRLGGPASHGCIRLHPANAAALFALVKSEGMGQRPLLSPGATLLSRAALRHRHGAMDGRGPTPRIDSGQMTDSPQATIGVHNRLPTITGVESLGLFRSSICTDAYPGQFCGNRQPINSAFWRSPDASEREALPH